MAKHKAPKIHKIKDKDISEGVYLTDGPHGAGWYHTNTPDDQIFRGHPGERDVILFDVNLTQDGSYNELGNDQITHWDNGFDFARNVERFPVVTYPNGDNWLEYRGVIQSDYGRNGNGRLFQLAASDDLTGPVHRIIDENIGTLTFWAVDAIG
jgi:hypothetical protein